jgi:hypothetical protein
LKDLLKVIIGAGLAVVVLVSIMIVVMWAWDVYSDRQHTVEINGPTPFFEPDPGEACDRGSSAGTLQPGAEMKVLRIRYRKNCMVIEARASDNGIVYLVAGVGQFEFK